MRTKNKYLDKIAAIVGETDYNRSAACIVERFRKSGDTLLDAASRLGVDAIVEEELSFDGGLFEQNGRTIIKLSSFSSRTRKRFTLAHEISHLILATTVRVKSSCMSDCNLERACDMLAAELVMPAQEVTQFVQEMGSSSPENLKRLAHRFDVSLHSAAVRVHQDLKLWKRHIGLWKWESGPKQLWFVGKRPWGTDSPGFAAFDTARESNRPVRSMDSVRRGQYTEKVSLELLNIGDGSVCILGLIGTVS
ncbi:MAG: ImmA/IrrE family metallo-endopeptidase [Candidatus Acidiferrales bacterium]